MEEINQKSRHLASIQQVVNIRTIPGAKNIEVTRILGWDIVTRMGQFKIGDPVVFFEIDSILPQTPEFEFMKDKHYKVKTAKFLKIQISQGLCMPLSILPPGKYAVGDDVTEILGVTKYEKPIPVQLRGRVRGRFPMGIHRTDEVRIQNCPDVLERNKGKTFQISEKLDGTSCTMFLDPETGLHVCSRTLDLAPDFEHKFNGTIYWSVAKNINAEEILKALGKTIAVQGEIIGPKIQDNKYELKEHQFRVFNLWNMVSNCYLEHDVMMDALEGLGLPKDFYVPYLGTIELNHTVDEIVQMAAGRSVLNENTLREGLVFRSVPESIDYEIGRLSFKAISPEFNLHYKE